MDKIFDAHFTTKTDGKGTGIRARRSYREKATADARSRPSAHWGR